MENNYIQMYNKSGTITVYQLIALTAAFVCGSLLRGGGIFGAAVIIFWLVRSALFACRLPKVKSHNPADALYAHIGNMGKFSSILFSVSLSACAVIGVYGLSEDIAGLYSGVPEWIFAVGIILLCLFALRGKMTAVGRGAELCVFAIAICLVYGIVKHKISGIPTVAQIYGVDTLGCVGAVINLICLTALPSDSDSSGAYAASGIKIGKPTASVIGALCGGAVYIILCVLDCGIFGILAAWILKLIRLYIIVLSLSSLTFSKSLNYNASSIFSAMASLTAFSAAVISGRESAVTAIAVISATVGISAVIAISVPRRAIKSVSHFLSRRAEEN